MKVNELIKILEKENSDKKILISDTAGNFSREILFITEDDYRIYLNYKY